jgi:hypothetical protein
MNAKNLESFKEALICQYRDLIKEAILESEEDHKSRLNIGTLNNKLNMICKAAKYDGLGEQTINQLIDEATTPVNYKAVA